MGAGTLRRNGDLDSHGTHVYDTLLTAETMKMTPNMTTRDTANWRQRTVTTTVTTRDTTVTTRDTNVTDRRTTDTHDTNSTSAYDSYLRLTTITRLDDTARLPTTSDYRVHLELRLNGPYDRLRNVFRIRCVRLLSLCVNAIILETASSFVSPDYVCSLFTSTVRSSSTRVYSPRRPTLYERPYDLRLLRVHTSPYESPAV